MMIYCRIEHFSIMNRTVNYRNPILVRTLQLERARNSDTNSEVLAKLGAFEKRIWACDNRIEEVYF